MEQFEQLDQQTRNLITIGVEILAVVVLFLILGFILGRLLGLLSGMKKGQGGVQLVRRNLRFLLIFLCFVACLGVGGANAYLMVKGEDLLAYQLELLASVPREVWTSIAIGLGKGVGLVLVVRFALKYVRRLLAACSTRAQAFDQIKANDESIEQFFESLTKMVSRASWLVVLAIIAGWIGLPDGAQAALWTALRIFLIISGGLLVWRALDAMIDSLDAWSRRFAKPGNWLAYYEKLSHLVPLFRRTVEFALYIVVAMLVVMQVAAIADLGVEWGPRLIKVVGTLFVARVAIEIVNLLIEEFLIKRADLTADQRQRRLTIIPLFRSAAKYLIYFSAGVIVLGFLTINTTSILAGAGIVTLAVGLGAQNLINDMVSGFFILFENYYLVGDYIRVNGSEGVVEAIDMRATRIRDNDGRLHIVRNGQVDDLVNFSKEYTMAVVEVGVAYESDLEAVFGAFEEAGERLAQATGDTLAPLELRGLKEFGESELTIRAQVRVKPGKHRDVEFPLRRILWEVFEERGIEIPYARRVVIFKPEPPADEAPKEGSGNPLSGSAPASA